MSTATLDVETHQKHPRPVYTTESRQPERSAMWQASQQSPASTLRDELATEDGIATAEFSIVTLAAVGFAGLLVTILSGGQVKGMLTSLITKALGL